MKIQRSEASQRNNAYIQQLAQRLSGKHPEEIALVLNTLNGRLKERLLELLPEETALGASKIARIKSQINPATKSLGELYEEWRKLPEAKNRQNYLKSLPMNKRKELSNLIQKIETLKLNLDIMKLNDNFREYVQGIGDLLEALPKNCLNEVLEDIQAEGKKKIIQDYLAKRAQSKRQNNQAKISAKSYQKNLNSPKPAQNQESLEKLKDFLKTSNLDNMAEAIEPIIDIFKSLPESSLNEVLEELPEDKKAEFKKFLTESNNNPIIG